MHTTQEFDEPPKSQELPSIQDNEEFRKTYQTRPAFKTRPVLRAILRSRLEYLDSHSKDRLTACHLNWTAVVVVGASSKEAGNKSLNLPTMPGSSSPDPRRSDKVSNLLWAVVFVIYTWAVTVRGRLSARDCDCEELVAAYSLPMGKKLSALEGEEGVNEACYDPIRWAVWTENTTLMKSVRPLVPPGKKLAGNTTSQNKTRAITNTTAANQSQSAQRVTMRPFRPPHRMPRNHKFYGFAGNTTEDPPDREAYISFFTDDQITANKTGTFVEVGAGNGRRHSNTLFFEESLGWGGLLIEGNEETGKQLLANKARRAFHTKRVKSTICEPKLEDQEVRYVGAGDGAGVETYMSKEHVRRYEASWGKGWRQRAKLTKCTTLRAVLERAGIGSVDLMTINVAGAEKATIEGLDVKKVHVRVLVVAMENEHGGTERTIRKLLMEKGFCFAYRLGRNEYWVADDVLKRAHCAWAGLLEDL